MFKPLKRRLIFRVFLALAVLWLAQHWYWSVFRVPTIKSIAYSPDGRLIACGGGWLFPHDGDDLGGAVWLWNAKNGDFVGRFSGNLHVIGAIAFTEDGRTLCAWQGDGLKVSWEVQTGRFLGTDRSNQSDENRYQDDINRQIAAVPNQVLAYLPSPSGNRVASAEDARRFRGDLSRISKYKAWTKPESLLELASNRRVFATISDAAKSDECRVTIRRFPEGQPLHHATFEIVSSHIACFSPDGTVFAVQNSGGYSPSSLFLWDTSSGKTTKAQKNTVVFAQSMAFSPDGKTLVEGGGYGGVQVWDTASGKTLMQLQAR